MVARAVMADVFLACPIMTRVTLTEAELYGLHLRHCGD